MSSPTADVSVRIAWADDAAAIAELQVRTWREVYADLLPADALPDDVAAAAAAWQASLSQPRRRPQPGAGGARAQPGRRLRDHLPRRATPTATRSSTPSSPRSRSTRPSAARATAPACCRRPADTLVADRFQRAVLWSMAGDDALRKFLTEAGWAADGAHRELDLDGAGTTLVKQVRLHTALTGRTS